MNSHKRLHGGVTHHYGEIPGAGQQYYTEILCHSFRSTEGAPGTPTGAGAACQASTNQQMARSWSGPPLGIRAAVLASGARGGPRRRIVHVPQTLYYASLRVL
ncbi:hypothetical protein NDU88_008187 [Pleurodeles waltl]|uniref:Uncharacterized protein n=1 Tax=Pleurodeles waltl TaxID=8319 RepID=A0AAV7N486_PLEWA|nr:hypothetical protein NDU88_008187 [Pleurodeles waltl]